MTVDPVFVLNPDMTDDLVDTRRTAKWIYECNGKQRDRSLRRLELVDGRKILVPSEKWMAENGGTPFQFISDLGATKAQIIEQTGDSGEPNVLVDHTAEPRRADRCPQRGRVEADGVWLLEHGRWGRGDPRIAGPARARRASSSPEPLDGSVTRGHSCGRHRVNRLPARCPRVAPTASRLTPSRRAERLEGASGLTGGQAWRTKSAVTCARVGAPHRAMASASSAPSPAST